MTPQQLDDLVSRVQNGANGVNETASKDADENWHAEVADQSGKRTIWEKKKGGVWQEVPPLKGNL